MLVVKGNRFDRPLNDLTFIKGKDRQHQPTTEIRLT